MAGAVLLVIAAVVGAFIYLQFRGDPHSQDQADPAVAARGPGGGTGFEGDFNGVEIGRVSHISLVDERGTSMAKLTLDVNPRYIQYIPANVEADVRATTVFGNKYISFSSPKDPSPQRISSNKAIHASAVTTESNTLFETVTSIAAQVDPIKLNQTLAATAEALTGLGDRFGQSLENGNQILDDLNPKTLQIARDNRGLADLAEVYADASPDLWQGLENAVETAQTFDDYRANIDEAPMAAVGFANDAADSVERGGPYLVRGAADLVPTTRLLDDYRGMIFCTFRKFSDVQKRASAVLGGNGYSLASASGALAGAGNPYVYPDNLPRVNAHRAGRSAPAAGRTSTDTCGPRRIW